MDRRRCSARRLRRRVVRRLRPSRARRCRRGRRSRWRSGRHQGRRCRTNISLESHCPATVAQTEHPSMPTARRAVAVDRSIKSERSLRVPGTNAGAASRTGDIGPAPYPREAECPARLHESRIAGDTQKLGLRVGGVGSFVCRTRRRRLAWGLCGIRKTPERESGALWGAVWFA